MADNLHRILENVEAMDMPEGDYLRIANALRAAFQQAPDTRVWRRTKYVLHDHPEISFKRGRTVYEMRIESYERSEMRSGTDSRVFQNTRVSYKQRTGTAPWTNFRTVAYEDHYHNVIRNFLCTFDPMTVCVVNTYGKIICTYKQGARYYEKQYKILKKQWDGASDDRKVTLAEIMADFEAYTYADFLSFVTGKIPKSEHQAYDP